MKEMSFLSICSLPSQLITSTMEALRCDDNVSNNNNNSILVYLRANSTAQRPITKRAGIGRRKTIKHK
jgi:hypothetical protein